jgi:hypothetical protein
VHQKPSCTDENASLYMTSKSLGWTMRNHSLHDRSKLEPSSDLAMSRRVACKILEEWVHAIMTNESMLCQRIFL